MTVELTQLYELVAVLVALAGAWNVVTAGSRYDRLYAVGFWGGVGAFVGGMGVVGYGVSPVGAGVVAVLGLAVAFGTAIHGARREVRRLREADRQNLRAAIDGERRRYERHARRSEDE